MPTIVALDIETTGLDPYNDVIIEIGAVKFNGRRVEAEFSTLVNPRRPIPPFITQLTGITNEMVRNAPPLQAVLRELTDFVGDHPVLGHNVRFDLSFLQRQNVLLYNDWIDTYELAAVLLPTSSRYNLGALGQSLNILLPATHRALDDARVTHALFLQLYEKALTMPVELVAEFLRLSEPFDWGGYWLFKQILQARSRQPIQAKYIMPIFREAALPRDDEVLDGAPDVQRVIPLDEDEASAVLEHGGVFARYFRQFEYRPQQVEMLRAIARSFTEGSHLLVEAGTGTGKSFAYLVPAALWALQNHTRVVISTNTINLQDQLIKKDIPDLRNALGVDLRSIVLKGRANYLCPRRLQSMRERGPATADEMRVLAKVLVWLMESDSGDRTEINLNGPAERDAWMRICAEDEGCKAEACLSRTGGACPFYRARQAAQNAHLIVVNHALLLADIATGSRVLPEYKYLIVDEGHHLEAATTSALSYKVTQGDLTRLLRELGGKSSGVLGRILSLLANILRPSDLAAATQTIERSTDLAFRLEHYLDAFFTSVENFMAEQRDGRPMGTYAQQERVTHATRTQPAWSDVEIAWEQANETLKLLLNLLSDLYRSVASLSDEMDQDLEDAQSSLSDLFRRLSENQVMLCAMVNTPDPNNIYWVELQPNNHHLALQVAPLHIGGLMEQYLWHEKSSIIVTSATLTAADEFGYLRGRLNADEADELTVGSPFDYQSAAMLYLANDIPEPNDVSNYQRAIDQAIIRLAKATHGRMLALFTNYQQLKRTSQNIAAPLAEADIQVYEQGEGASANSLLETFREADQAVLLGTRSFWEGVDIPGEALSVLVITRLPFDVPTDPIVSARSETFDDPFNEYNLPEAILRFRQGFGRLIRTQSDRGVVAILDRRILTKKYGKLFTESLPECKLKIGPVNDLPAAAARWLNL